MHGLEIESRGESGKVKIDVSTDKKISDVEMLREAIGIMMNQLYTIHDENRKEGMDEYDRIQNSFADMLYKLGEIIKEENMMGGDISEFDAVKLFIEQYK